MDTLGARVEPTLEVTTESSGMCPETEPVWRAKLVERGQASCPRCAYSLQGLPVSGTCPECGFAYDPDATVIRIRRSRRWLRHVTLAAVLALLWLLISATGMWLRTDPWIPIFVILAGGWYLLRFALTVSNRYTLELNRSGIMLNRENKPGTAVSWNAVGDIRHRWLRRSIEVIDANGRTAIRISDEELGGRASAKRIVEALLRKKQAYSNLVPH